MPWSSGKEFASRHNHGLHGAAATKASHIANAILRSGGDEGVAIATANKYAKNHRAEGGSTKKVGYDDEIPGIASPNAFFFSPKENTDIGDPVEIDENDPRTRPPHPNMLNIYRWHSGRESSPPSDNRDVVIPSPDVYNRGSNMPIINRSNGGLADISAALHIAKRDAGGFTPPITPGYERAEERELASAKPYGFTAGTGPGRLDKNNVDVGAGSYVLPADVVAGLGDGNSLAGAAVWNKILGSMPYGITTPKSAGHRGPPAPPHNAQMMQGITGEGQKAFAEGGETPEVPIKSADGEIILSPEDVMRLGMHYAPDREKDNHAAVMRRAHKILDGFVKHVRGRTIKHLKGLRGPVGSKDASKGHI